VIDLREPQGALVLAAHVEQAREDTPLAPRRISDLHGRIAGVHVGACLRYGIVA